MNQAVTVNITKGFGDFTPGTFSASGGVTDAGVYQLLDGHDAALPSPVVGTGHDTFALTGTGGTITMKSETVFRVVSFDPLLFGQDGHWRIVGGTGDFANLKGEGEYHKLIDVSLGQITITLTGLVHAVPGATEAVSSARTTTAAAPIASGGLSALDLWVPLDGTTFDAFVPAAFTGLDVAVERFYPVEPNVPPNPVQVAPVFVLNYGDTVDIVFPDGLNVALSHYPTDPNLTASPIFFGLADALPPVVDG